MRQWARDVPEWQADVVALPSVLPGGERKRVVGLLVAADDLVVWGDSRLVTTCEPGDVAALLEEAVSGAASAVGVFPETVLVRREEVARALAPLSRERGYRVEAGPFLPGLDLVAGQLADAMAGPGSSNWPAVAPPATWAAWGLPDQMVAELFRAYAAFWKAAPWRWFDNLPPLAAEWDDGEELWLVPVLGAGEEEFGLVVYSHPDDFDMTLAWEEGEPPFQDLCGWIVHLGYNRRREVGRTMLKEISRAGWEVAAPEAYPFILPIMTPGGGLQRELVRQLTDLLHGVAALAETHGEKLRSPAGGVFTRRQGRLTLRYLLPPAEGWEGDLPPGLAEILDEVRTGPFGSLEDLQAALNQGVDEYHGTPQEELGGISPDQARALLVQRLGEGGPLRLAPDLPGEELEGSPFLADARTFLAALLETGGTPATAAGNLKRAFVAEMLERMRWGQVYRDGPGRMNRALNEEDVWPLHLLRVNLEVAGLIRRRKGAFLLTRKGRELASPEAAGRLFAHLFRVHFGEFDLRYGRMVREEEPDLQGVFPLLLWQIGVRAREWITVESLCRGILPRSPGDEAGPGSPALRLEALSLHATILDPLVRFGLLEARQTGERSGGRWRPEENEVRITPLFGRFLSFQWE